MKDKKIKKLTDQYLRADIKTMKHDKKISKNLIILTRDLGLFVLIIYILFNQKGTHNDRNNVTQLGLHSNIFNVVLKNETNKSK